MARGRGAADGAGAGVRNRRVGGWGVRGGRCGDEWNGILTTPSADTEVFNLKAIAGEVDWAITMTNFASLPDYKENEERGNYTISLIPGVDVGRAFGFNPTYKRQKEDSQSCNAAHSSHEGRTIVLISARPVTSGGRA